MGESDIPDGTNVLVLNLAAGGGGGAEAGGRQYWVNQRLWITHGQVPPPPYLQPQFQMLHPLGYCSLAPPLR